MHMHTHTQTHTHTYTHMHTHTHTHKHTHTHTHTHLISRAMAQNTKVVATTSRYAMGRWYLYMGMES